MKTIYLDSKFMCHLVNEDDYLEVQTDSFDTISDNAIPFYRFVPKGKRWKGAICAENLIENTNPKMVNAIQKEYNDGQQRLNDALTEIAQAMGIETEYFEED